MTVLLITGGCASPPEPRASARLAELKKSGLELEHSIDSLEQRFLGNQSRIGLWQELADRHKQVSAVACENAASHMAGMNRLQEHELAKANQKARRFAQASAADTIHAQARN